MDPHHLSNNVWDKLIKLRSIRKRCIDPLSTAELESHQVSELSMNVMDEDAVDDPNGGSRTADPLAMKRAEVHADDLKGARKKEEELQNHLTDMLELKRIVKEEIDIVAANRKNTECREIKERGGGGVIGGGGGLSEEESHWRNIEGSLLADQMALGEEASNLSTSVAIKGFVEIYGNHDSQPPISPTRSPVRRERPVGDVVDDLEQGQPLNDSVASPSTHLLAEAEVRKICHLAGVLNNILERVNCVVPEGRQDFAAANPMSAATTTLSAARRPGVFQDTNQFKDFRAETFQETIKTLMDEYQRREEDAEVWQEDEYVCFDALSID